MNSAALRALAVAVIAALWPVPADAKPLAVTAGVHVSPPFVAERSGSYHGMAVELWKSLAERTGATTRFVEYPTLRELIAATAAGEVDVAVTNLAVNRERADHLEFTQPWFDAGMRVLVHAGTGMGLWHVLDGLADAGHLQAYFWLIYFIIAATILLTLFDRRFDREFPRRWSEGLADSFYHVMSVATSGSTSRRNLFGALGKVLSAIWLVFGVAVVAYVTSSITSVMTAAAITNQIDGAADLKGRTIGVINGSVAEDYAVAAGWDIREFNNIDDASGALVGGEVDAVVGDAPLLEYHVNQNPDEGLDVVGALFAPHKYGFATPIGSPLSRSLNLELLAAHEDGTVEAHRAAVFGNHD